MDGRIFSFQKIKAFLHNVLNLRLQFLISITCFFFLTHDFLQKFQLIRHTHVRIDSTADETLQEHC